MVEEVKKIVKEGAVWDLHIHTPLCPKGTDEFSKMEIKDYIDKLAELIGKYEHLKMISFTDHNTISLDVYKEFYSRNFSITLITGVEVDVIINSDLNNIKHVIFYFDIDLKTPNFEDKVKEINKLLPKDGKGIKFSDVIEEFLKLKVPFLMSPHTFGKQGARDITRKWHSDPKILDEERNKYMDQFFCFWETSGMASIAKGKEFLIEYENEEKISLVNFSDSDNFLKMENYLKNPTQYFNALSNFKGLQMVSTDVRRVTEERYKTNPEADANTISFVKTENGKIELSDRLNVIIGGRGSGKSLFLDSLSVRLQEENAKKLKEKNEKRLDFINSLNIIPLDSLSNEKSINILNIDYYDQAYVSKLFDNEGENLKRYFSDEFKQIDELDKNTYDANLKESYKKKLAEYNIPEVGELENIANFVQKYINGNFEVLKMKKDGTILKKAMIFPTNQINEIDIHSQYELIINNPKIVPKQIKDDTEVKKSVIVFQKELISKLENYNSSLESKMYENKLISTHYDYNKELSEILKNKNDVEEQFQNYFKKYANIYSERVAIVNTIFNSWNNLLYHKENSNIKTTKEKDAFKFTKELNLKNLINYFIEKCDEYISTDKTRFKINLENVDRVVECFCFNLDSVIKESKKASGLIKDLKALNNYGYEYNNKIYYKINGEYQDVSELSPGSQSNILMEYIVFKDTKKPLLIDQPEDNIDNETIFDELTTWFNKLKYKRQIIVVTHDANIVINGDAENVIISKQLAKNKFEYYNGALEYNDILEKSAIILDGGKKAVERRMKKYGE